jgi:hypothetical protein
MNNFVMKSWEPTFSISFSLTRKRQILSSIGGANIIHSFIGFRDSDVYYLNIMASN